MHIYIEGNNLVREHTKNSDFLHVFKVISYDTCFNFEPKQTDFSENVLNRQKSMKCGRVLLTIAVPFYEVKTTNF